MSSDFDVIWRKGDDKMPDNVKHIVSVAQDELLLKSLQLPFDAIDVIRYNTGKGAKTVNEYISSLVLDSLNVAQ